MKMLREYRPEVRQYLKDKTKEAARLWNKGHSASEIEAFLDVSDRLCRDLLCRAVTNGLITRRPKATL